MSGKKIMTGLEQARAAIRIPSVQRITRVYMRGPEAPGAKLETTETERAEWADDLDYNERPSIADLRRLFRDFNALTAALRHPPHG